MNNIFLIILAAWSLPLLASTNTANICIGSLDSNGSCHWIQAKCQGGYCTESIYDEKNKRDVPLPKDPYAWNNAQQQITSVGSNNRLKQVTLSDGSVWNVPSSVNKVEEWLSQAQLAPVAFTLSSDFFLASANNDKAMAVTLDMKKLTPENQQKMPKKIQALFTQQNMICLNDHSCWEYESDGTKLQPEIRLSPVLLGINRSLKWQSYPNVMLIVRPNQHPTILKVKRLN